MDMRALRELGVCASYAEYLALPVTVAEDALLVARFIGLRQQREAEKVRR